MRNHKTKRYNKRKNNKTRKHLHRRNKKAGGLIEMFNNLKEKGINMLNKAQQRANIVMGKKPIINTSPQSPDENALERFNKAQESLDNNPNVYADPNSMSGGRKHRSKKNKNRK